LSRISNRATCQAEDKLQPKEEVLLLGWGVPMPLPVRSRRYDEQFWKELLGGREKKSKEQNLKELGF